MKRLFLLLALSLSACGQGSTSSPASSSHIVFIGDSLTRGTFNNYSGNSYVSYANRIASERSNVTVAGVDGSSSTYWANAEINFSVKPDLAFIMLGTNDTSEQTPLPVFIDNLKHIASALGCRAVYITPPVTLNPERNLEIKRYADAIKASFADVIDVNALPIPVAGFSPDGLHLLNPGHEVIYNAVKSWLEKNEIKV